MKTPISPRSCHSDHSCTCTGACTGYETSKSCPPLIVLAILAVSTPLAVWPCLVGAAR